jgi:hypothetical protein
VRLAGAELEAMLWLDLGLCEHWAPTRRAATVSLNARSAALGTETLSLDVVLDLGQSRLVDTHGLRVGDVLVSQTPLDSAFQLVHPDARRLANVRLYRQDRQRVLQLESFVPARAKP